MEGDGVKVNLLLAEDDYVLTCRYSKDQAPVAMSWPASHAPAMRGQHLGTVTEEESGRGGVQSNELPGSNAQWLAVCFM